jgi:hypothetical protein
MKPITSINKGNANNSCGNGNVNKETVKNTKTIDKHYDYSSKEEEYQEKLIYLQEIKRNRLPLSDLTESNLNNRYPFL